MQLGLELPADIPLASIPANPSSTQALPPLASPFSSTRKLPGGEHLPLASQTPRGSQHGPTTAAGGGAAAEAVPQLAATPATQAQAPPQGGRTPRGSMKGYVDH